MPLAAMRQADGAARHWKMPRQRVVECPAGAQVGFAAVCRLLLKLSRLAAVSSEWEAARGVSMSTANC
jgi:hypothetical protein